MAKTKKKTDETQKSGPRTVATNRKARHEYFIEDTFEAGIALTGTEIKSIRAGRVSLREGFVMVRDGEAIMMNVHIGHYEHGNQFNHEEKRPRKLLLHKKEIQRLHSQATQRNWTIVPLRVYITGRGLAKVEIALVQGKRQHDKRETIAQRDSEREMQRAIKNAR